MAPRKRVQLREDRRGSSYFAAPAADVQFFHSGSTLLDCCLGGGWAAGRVINVVGDKSTGKTLLAIEAINNIFSKYDDAEVWYGEAEAAFDKGYAQALGLPVDRVTFSNTKKFPPLFTVEDFYKHLENLLEGRKKGAPPGLYILDSLDALSDKAELDREIDAGSYGATKAKQLSEVFRRINQRLADTNVTLFIISQIRDKIGISFGKKYSRSGGKALDFYASQVVYLAHIGTNSRTINKQKRVTGVNIKAKVDKNKVGLPFRTCEFEIVFGFGIDDINANLNWLKETKLLKEARLSESELEGYRKDLVKMDDAEYRKECREIAAVVGREWYKIEEGFLPTRKKYR